MKTLDLLKKEIKSYTQKEFIFLVLILFFIFINGFFIKDNIIAILSASFGILYTINAGKGKVICYFYGLIGSFCYSYLAFINGLWGNLALWIVYYIPLEITGIFLWKKNINKKTNTIKKTKLNFKKRLILFLICLIGSFLTILILKYFQDSNPILDGITTFLSIIGMFLTIKRLIEQWYIWILVNGISLIMWLIIFLNGEKVFSTIFMWLVYLFLAFYFLKQWKKEI